MRRSTLIFAAVVFGVFSCVAQQSRKPPEEQPLLSAPVRLPGPNILPAGYPLRLVLTRTVDPRKIKAGESIPFVLLSDFYFRDVLLAERGTPVTATVRKAKRAGAFGKGSQLVIQLESLRTHDGGEVPLRGSAEASGGTDFPVAVQATEAVFGYAVFPPALAISALLFAVPGKTEPLPEGSLAIAYVDRDTPLGSIDQEPSRDGATDANVRVIRGENHWARSADLFCNGIPVAHLRHGRLLELRFVPGWYRFSLKPDRPALFYAVPGRTYFVLTDDRDVTLSEPGEVNEETIGRLPSRFRRTLGGLLADSKPIDKSDIYSTKGCTPLKEEFAMGSQH